ncbi:hypothetical protein ABN034_21385 [Actinopolymorpha sp. B11F2]|uniref:hypothetical protein n=1 Tax=Actinopolymorpha sp. B11F2 TaxID=3160862 RepID=UPI0032E4034E
MSNSTHHKVDRGVTPLRVNADLTSTTYLYGSAVDRPSGPVVLLTIGLYHSVDFWIRDLETLDRLSAAIEQARTAFLDLDTDHMRKVG